MANPYAEIFSRPGAKAFSATAFIARLPISMVTLGVVTMLSQTHGQYWLAGGVSATFALANALIAPQISRLVDRRGQTRVAVPATIVAVTSLAALILATRFGAPAWTLFLFAALAGFMPSMSALVRARWTELYRGAPQLHTAFAFESVVDEMIYMAGPVMAVGFSVSFFPEAGPLAAAALLAIGMSLFLAQKSTEPPVHARERSNEISVIRQRPVLLVALTMVALGAIFGTSEVTALAFAEAHGQKGAASLVLAAYAAGSLVTGLAFGAWKLKTPLRTQFVIAIALAMATTLPLLIVDSVVALAAILFLAGVSISPSVITAMSLIERLVPASKLTEGITWVVTGVGVGMAIGSAASGWAIDTYGAQYGFCVSVAGGVIALIIALASYRSLQAPTRAPALREVIA